MTNDNTAAAVAQLVERVLGKDEVTGPNPVSSSVKFGSIGRWPLLGFITTHISMQV